MRKARACNWFLLASWLLQLSHSVKANNKANISKFLFVEKDYKLSLMAKAKTNSHRLLVFIIVRDSIWRTQ